jgi:hypothetical protein
METLPGGNCVETADWPPCLKAQILAAEKDYLYDEVKKGAAALNSES